MLDWATSLEYSRTSTRRRRVSLRRPAQGPGSPASNRQNCRSRIPTQRRSSPRRRYPRSTCHFLSPPRLTRTELEMYWLTADIRCESRKKRTILARLLPTIRTLPYRAILSRADRSLTAPPRPYPLPHHKLRLEKRPTSGPLRSPPLASKRSTARRSTSDRLEPHRRCPRIKSSPLSLSPPPTKHEISPRSSRPPSLVSSSRRICIPPPSSNHSIPGLDRAKTSRTDFGPLRRRSTPERDCTPRHSSCPTRSSQRTTSDLE